MLARLSSRQVTRFAGRSLCTTNRLQQIYDPKDGKKKSKANIPLRVIGGSICAGLGFYLYKVVVDADEDICFKLTKEKITELYPNLKISDIGEFTFIIIFKNLIKFS